MFIVLTNDSHWDESESKVLLLQSKNSNCTAFPLIQDQWHDLDCFTFNWLVCTIAHAYAWNHPHASTQNEQTLVNANRLVNQHSKHFVVAFGPWKANMNCNLTNCVFVLRNESLLLLITSLPDSWAECRKPWRMLECRFLELPQTSKTTEIPLAG